MREVVTHGAWAKLAILGRGLGPWVLAAAALFWSVLPEAALAEALASNIDSEVVYLDPDGVIHVFDPNRPNDVLYVAWQSPEGGWTQIQAADVTGDGDAEIVALAPTATGGRIAIFDPVARDLDPAGLPQINGVPWRKVYEAVLPGLPRVLLTGEFDASRAGPEILYGYQIEPGEDLDRFVVLRQPEGGTGGHVWEQMRAWQTEGVWTGGAVGSVGAEADVAAFVDRTYGTIEVYRVSPSVVRMFRRSNSGNGWRDVAFGQFNSGGALELGAVRDAELPLASAWVFRYENGTFVDDYFQELSPGPFRVFFADIGGNGDDEMVMLRQVPQEYGPRPRLIIRDRGNDTLGFSEELLDGDNEYQGGVGGDVDGDGRDEIVIIRNNRIRVYTEPERSAARTDTVVATDRQTVVVGNVDALGLARSPTLYSATTQLTADLVPGGQSAPVAVGVFDVATSANLPFAFRVENAEWASVSPSGNTLPVTLTVTFGAEGLASGEYAGRLIVEAAGSEVQNNPWVISLNLAVESGVGTEPGSLFFGFDDCSSVPARNVRVGIAGPEGFGYSLALDGNPEWVTVAPEEGVFPETVILSVDPKKSQRVISESALVITFELPGAPSLTEATPVVLTCGAERLFLPVVMTGQ